MVAVVDENSIAVAGAEVVVKEPGRIVFRIAGRNGERYQQRKSAVVNKVVDSPQFGVFTEPVGRALTARIRLIQSR